MQACAQAAEAHAHHHPLPGVGPLIPLHLATVQASVHAASVAASPWPAAISLQPMVQTCVHPKACVQKEMTGKDPRVSLPLAYLHIDCDLYAGSRDALTLLSHKIVPGTVLLFDELVNYNTYREHEVKALFEWLLVSGAKIATIGMKGPIPGLPYAFDKDIQVKEHPQHHQSAAFVVVHKPGATTRIAW